MQYSQGCLHVLKTGLLMHLADAHDRVMDEAATAQKERCRGQPLSQGCLRVLRMSIVNHHSDALYKEIVGIEMEQNKLICDGFATHGFYGIVRKVLKSAFSLVALWLSCSHTMNTTLCSHSYTRSRHPNALIDSYNQHIRVLFFFAHHRIREKSDLPPLSCPFSLVYRIFPGT